MNINCPVCGAQVPSRLKYAKLLACSHCKTTLFLEDNAVRNAGNKSALTEIPSLLSLGRRYQYRQWTFEPYGRVQFDYGEGVWDEWWVVLDSGDGKWISVDEGDFAVESRIKLRNKLPAFEALSIGQKVRLSSNQGDLIVTEKNDCVCLGVEGELPEQIEPGEKHNYVHISGGKGLLMTIEYSGGEASLFKGVWIDPFDIRPL